MERSNLKFIYLFVCVGFFSSCQNENDPIVEMENETFIETKALATRQLTSQEAASLKKDFPSLNTSNVLVTGESDPMYNCIAWNLGISWRWINPPQYITDFEYLYEHAKQQEGAVYNYMKTSIYNNADIFGFGKSSSSMTHTSVHYSGSTYESKLGSDFRITHDKYGIEGGIYGYILTAFDRSYNRNLTDDQIEGLAILAKSVNEENDLTDQEKNNVVSKASMLDCKEKFNVLFNAWKNNWRTNAKTKYSNDTNDAKSLETFKPLFNMGVEIIPLIMEKLLDKEIFFALTLYDELQKIYSQKIVYNKTDINILEGEQNRVKKTIRLWMLSTN